MTFQLTRYSTDQPNMSAANTQLPTLALHPCHTPSWLQVTHVLATRVHTDTLAGLPGMLLSQVEPGADVGKPGGAAVTASVYGEQTPCLVLITRCHDRYLEYLTLCSLDTC